MMINAESVIFFSLIFIRISSIIMTAPLLGSPAIPPRIKLSLALVLTFLFLPLAGGGEYATPGDFITLVAAAGRELFIGVSIGFMANLVFAGINLAGQLMGFQMGFAIVNVLDPLNQVQVSIISQFLGFMALVIFVSLNAHHIFIQAIADSFSIAKIGAASVGSLAVREMMKGAAELFLIGLKVGAPVFAILLFTNVGLGVVARTVPQMNVFIVGFPLTIGIGLIALGLVLPLFLEVLRGLFDGMGRNIYLLLKGM